MTKYKNLFGDKLDTISNKKPFWCLVAWAGMPIYHMQGCCTAFEGQWGGTWPQEKIKNSLQSSSFSMKKKTRKVHLGLLSIT